MGAPLLGGVKKRLSFLFRATSGTQHPDSNMGASACGPFPSGSLSQAGGSVLHPGASFAQPGADGLHPRASDSQAGGRVLHPRASFAHPSPGGHLSHPSAHFSHPLGSLPHF